MIDLRFADAAGSLRMQVVGPTQQTILHELRRRGRSTLTELADTLGFTAPTLREHVKTLLTKGFVHEAGQRGEGPGRPSTLYALTPQGDELFPSMESQLLRDLAAYLIEHGHEKVLEGFFRERADRTRADIEQRVSGLTGKHRLEEVARIMTERGFMAEITGTGRRPQLRLCNCPLRHIVSVTKIPCRAEVDMLSQLLGQGVLRADYIPDGDSACSYAVKHHIKADRTG